MKSRKISLIQKFKIVLVSWTFGMIAGVIVALLRIFRLLRIKQGGKRKLDKSGLKKMMIENKKGVIIISNHPTVSGWEAVALPALFWPEFLFSWKRMPVSTPKSSLYNAKWFLIRPVCLSVIRDDKKAGADFINAMASALKEERTAVLFAEGGRTHNGDDFKWSEGKKIRRFKKGIEGILKRGTPIIIMAWVEGGIIRFGKPFIYAGEQVSELEDKLLILAGTKEAL